MLPEGSDKKNDNEVIGSVYVGVILHMQESVGNEYQGLKFGGEENPLSIILLAKQYTYEDDGFNNEKYDINAEYEKGVNCFAAGTKITMADYSLKNIEDVKEGDTVLSFNHEKGIYEGQRIDIVYAGKNKNKSFTLHFSNDVDLTIVGEHDLFEKESNKYVVISEEDATSYIGKHFFNASDNRFEELLSVTYNEEPVMYYSIYPEYTFNCIANGMLTLPDDVDEYLNIYEFNDDLSANLDALQKDIETYGLYEFENSGIFTQEEFEHYNGKYLNIYIGKGLVTLQDLIDKKQQYLNDK